MRIVADAAIPYLDACLEAALEGKGRIERMPGPQIDARAVHDADALLVRSVTEVDEALVADSALRFVGSATAGIDHVDVDALTRHGIAFGHSPGCNAGAVVQYVCTAIHHLAARHDPRLVDEPVGVIGFGNVGRRLTTRLRAMGLKVLANDPPLQAQGAAPESFVELDALLDRCRVVTLHIPLTRAGETAFPTHHLLDADRVRKLLARGACLINTSRGGVIDEAPLLEPGGDGRVVLDVWEREPAVRWRLLAATSPVALATPHIAGYSVEGKRAATAMVVERLGAALGLDPVALAPAPMLDQPLVADPKLAPVAAIADVFMRSCDLAALDLALRRLLDLAEAERPAAFEALRAGYPLRREPSAWRVRAFAPAVARGLRAAGFCVEPA